MKIYLIPSDFKIESLRVLDILALEHQVSAAKVVFLHAFKISDSINDMLLLSRRNRDYDGISDEFINALAGYKEKYSTNFSSFGIEHFYGSTTAVFKNFLETQRVDVIVNVEGTNFSPINKHSINPNVLIERAGYPVLTINTGALEIENDLAKWAAKNIGLNPSMA